MDTSLSHNSSNFFSGTTETTTETEPVMLSTQDREILEILEELENNASANFIGCYNNCNTKVFRMKGYFCSDSLQLKGTLVQILKICQYLRLHMEIICQKISQLFELCAREICEKFVYKHSETIEYVKN